jgi:hypothetical protein
MLPDVLASAATATLATPPISFCAEAVLTPLALATAWAIVVERGPSSLSISEEACSLAAVPVDGNSDLSSSIPRAASRRLSSMTSLRCRTPVSELATSDSAVNADGTAADSADAVEPRSSRSCEATLRMTSGVICLLTIPIRSGVEEVTCGMSSPRFPRQR